MRRVPLLRRGQSHIFNNVFYGYRKDIMSIRVGASVRFQNNIVVNNSNNSEGDDLDYWINNLLDEAVDDGALNTDGSYVWSGDSNCQLGGSPAEMVGASGSVPDYTSQYNSSSRNTINSNLFTASSDLADYVFASAGKGGAIPYVSAYSLGRDSIISQRPSSCQ